jgi:hypothetical protein
VIRRLVVVLLTLPLVAGLALLAPAPAQASGPEVAASDPVLGDRCHHPGKVTFNVKGVRSEIKVGYAKRFYLSPGEKVKEVRKVHKDMTIKARADFSYDAGGGISGVGKLLLKAEAKTHASLMAFGSYNKATYTTVKQTVSNPTSRNKKFVAFKATYQYQGHFKRLFCQQHPVQAYPTWVDWGKGTWQSHEELEEGTLRCGAGTPGAVATFVAQRHCG